MSARSALGHLTRSLRVGEKALILNQPDFQKLPETLQIRSSTFLDEQPIPILYTVSGDDVSPPLEWSHVPMGTHELVLIVEDYDVPFPKTMVHLIAYGLPPTSSGLSEGALPGRNAPARDPIPLLGRNGMGEERYDGPAALPGHGTHHYVFQLFAVNEFLRFNHAPDKDEIVKAMLGHVVATGRLTGTFERE
jgi:Raf kinase inhibitor-like YbhB/YbcL family protein